MYSPQKQGRVGRGFPRSERKRQLVSVLIECDNRNPRNGLEWFDTGDLAKLVGMKNTPNFLAIVKEMYSEEDLIMRVAQHRPNAQKFQWSLSHEAQFHVRYTDIFNCDLFAEPEWQNA